MNYELHDILAHGFLIFAAAVQLIPALFGVRVYRLNGYAKYWSEGWLLFIVVCLWIFVRRLLVAVTYEPSCLLTYAWKFDQIVSPIVTSVCLSAFAILKYKFFKHWLEKL